MWRAVLAVAFVSVIEVCELTKRYGSRVAVEDVSFAVRPGHVTGFLGANGSGKTTTMRIVLGLCRPDSACFGTRTRRRRRNQPWTTSQTWSTA